MTDFDLSEEHRLLRRVVRGLVQARVAPRAGEIDRSGQYPENVFQLFREQGLTALLPSEEEGGTGAGTLGLVVAVEEVARACASSAQILILQALCTWAIRLAGSAEQKGEYLPALASGERRGAFALTEPNAGSDVGGIALRAERNGDLYTLTGEKHYVSGGPQADFFVVFARTAPGGSEGVTAFLMPSTTPGLFGLRRDLGMGLRGLPHPDYSFDSCQVPARALLGKEGQGAETVTHSMNAIQPLLAARALGLIEECAAYARDYANFREIYGGHLGDLQAVQLLLADAVIAAETVRALTYQAARRVDQGLFRDPGDAYVLWATKTVAASAAVEASSKAMQVLGGHGYMDVHPLERMYRDARHLSLYGGADEVLKVGIARALLGNQVPYGPSVSRQPMREREV
ncbi:MAG: acyl-CoA dehydrogenase family protein [Chloroflexi bacterium]|nr:acyl-CoA dehydrogenase family protein [Chloroflexota bacterium]